MPCDCLQGREVIHQDRGCDPGIPRNRMTELVTSGSVGGMAQ